MMKKKTIAASLLTLVLALLFSTVSEANSDIKKEVYIGRQKRLLSLVKEKFGVQKGAILLIGLCEHEYEHSRGPFRQDSTFYYFTGVKEQGAVFLMDLSGKTTLFVPKFTPKYEQKRKRFYGDCFLDPENKEITAKFGFDEVLFLGEPHEAFSFEYQFKEQTYQNVLSVLKTYVQEQSNLYTLIPGEEYGHIGQQFILERIAKFVPGISERYKNISDQVAQLRRCKERCEIELMREAIDVTSMAFENAVAMIRPGITELEVYGKIDGTFLSKGANPGFYSIIAAGLNAVVLHHVPSDYKLADKDLILLDIGAERSCLCADISRTYPVSGKFTERQKELYNIVLETQQFVASRAMPGVYIYYPKDTSLSLHHMAIEFLEKRGYGKYMTHSIGHYLGMNPHDVGDWSSPIQEGDVITIEPGIYIPEEGIGIRIEDNYLITSDGAVCLSCDIPKSVEEIEAMKFGSK